MVSNDRRRSNWMIAVGLALVAALLVVGAVIVVAAEPDSRYDRVAAFIDAFWLVPVGLVGVVLYLFG